MIACLVLFAFGLFKDNFFIYLTIRMYGFDYSPIEHFKQDYYNLFAAIPQRLLMPIKWCSFGMFTLVYYYYQHKVLRYFFAEMNFRVALLGFFVGGALLLGLLLPISKFSGTALGIYQGISTVYLSPWPMILCFLYMETVRHKSFDGREFL